MFVGVRFVSDGPRGLQRGYREVSRWCADRVDDKDADGVACIMIYENKISYIVMDMHALGVSFDAQQH